MNRDDKTNGMLSPYRVLDLTDEKGLLCGKLLGDLGADVIKIERPGGDSARNNGPFYHDEPDPEKSLFWFAYNVNKRGITLDIETADGQELFKRLVKTADIVVESFAPGYMEKIGLGYEELEKVNPGIIMASITPFGQTGPYRDFKASDIVSWALGGYMYLFGDPDRSPVHVSHHSQAHLLAGSSSAVAAMIALSQRQKTGGGQHVDISVQECVAYCVEHPVVYWDTLNVLLPHGGAPPRPRLPFKWECKDGYIIWAFWGGATADRLMKPLVAWMDSEGMANDYIKKFDWPVYNFNDASQDVIDKIAEPTQKFFLAHTKSELYEGALKRRLQLFPLYNIKDILEDIQLKTRECWIKLEHKELSDAIMYPGPFLKATETPPMVSRKAPHIGEHNEEVLHELEISQSKTLFDKQKANFPEIFSKDTASDILTTKPLAGVRVIEFGSALAIPLTGRIMGAYGAEVIKMETVTRPELFRSTYPFKENIQGPNRAGRFVFSNTDKLSVTINITKPAGIELAKKLVAKADIVTENFAGGVMERLGLGYNELRKVKPDIIMLSSCMQGQTGPHSGHPGYGMQLTALSGFDSITGWADKPPVELEIYTDFTAPQLSLIALLSALDYRRRTGKGQYFDLSQYETAMQFIAPLILDYGVNGRVANRVGNKVENAAPHGAYCCLGYDRWCAIAVFTAEEWQGFCRVIGNPAWTKDSRFATLTARKENEDELNKLVESWTITRKAEDVMTMMQADGVGAGVVLTARDLVENDPHLKYRKLYPELEHPEIVKYRAIRPHFILSKSPTSLKRAPLLGEHNEYVFKQVLGMSDEEIAQMLIEGAIE
ncbi:MAG: CoA transferase [Dehalococcoidales bacterium]|nr:CoA transferase [Dehalococcoidales bacterium]